jgi:CrcB protein
MNAFYQILMLVGGGAAGSVLRGWLGELFAEILPWVTLGINVTGSFAAGWLNAWGDAHPAATWVKPLAIVGLCGGYTTFSSMVFQALVMWRKKQKERMAIYLTLTLILGLAAAAAGLALGHR